MNLVSEEVGSIELWNTVKIEYTKAFVHKKTTKALQEKEDKVQGKVIKAKEKLEQTVEVYKLKVEKARNIRIKHFAQEVEKKKKAFVRSESK